MSQLAIGLIRLYQRHISANRPPSCRFHPSCSEYGAQAIEHFGLLRGGLRAAWRILRCNPFTPAGYDPALPDRSLGHAPRGQRPLRRPAGRAG